MQFDSNTQTQMKKHIKNIEKGITFFSKQMAHNQTKIILIENGGKWINKPTNRQKDRATNKNEAEKNTHTKRNSNATDSIHDCCCSFANIIDLRGFE